MSTKSVDSHGFDRIECLCCRDEGRDNRWFHQLSVHLKSKHGISVEEYNERYPGAPTISKFGSKQVSNAQRGKTKKGSDKPMDKATSYSGDTETGEITTLHFGCAKLNIVPDTDLNAEDSALIPVHDPDFVVDEQLLEELALSIEQGDNVMVVGPTGCGKTHNVKELAALINQPMKRLNMRGDVRSANFEGEMALTTDEAGNNVTEFSDGPLVQAMENGWWLIVDELDAAPPHILFVLQAVLEDDHRLVLDKDGGREVHAHPRFRIIATGNTNGRGDETGLYTGTNLLNEAFLDRFVVLEQGYLPKRAEIDLVVQKSGISRDDATKMRKVAEKVRFGLKNDECNCTLSTRRLIRWARKAVRLGLRRAAKLEVLSKLSSDDREFVDGIIKVEII